MNLRTQSENKITDVEMKTIGKQLGKDLVLTLNGKLILTSCIEDKNAILHSLNGNQYDEKEIKALTHDITKETESYLTGWTEGGQKSYLKMSISKLVSENKIKNKKLADAFLQEKHQAQLLDLLYNAKYIFLTKELKDKDSYIDAFLQALSALEAIVGVENTRAYFTACLEENNICRLLPLAGFVIKAHCAHLEDFHLSELMAHRIAYAIAKSPHQVTQVMINDKNNQLLHSFTADEIHVKKNDGSRDLGLVGMMLTPHTDKNITPVLRIIWAGTHSAETIKIDGEVCPGEESYRRGEDQVLKQIILKVNALYQRCGKPIDIIISGHSLGGSLAQLTLHSLQRILTVNLKNNHSQQWEVDFQKKLTQETFGVEHQRSLAGIQLPLGRVQSLRLEAWNSPGVLKSVAEHSNQMCALLVEHGVNLSADYGMVHGDVVQTGGQAMVLGDVGKNQARVRILKIQPNSLDLTTKGMASVGAISVGRVIGAVAAGGPIGAMAAALTLSGVTYASLGKLTVDAHRMHHFKESKTPQHSYVILTSHSIDGSVNHTDTGCAAICKELSCKSVVVGVGSKALSLFGVTQARNATIEEKKSAVFNASIQQAEASKAADAYMELVISEMTNYPADASTRILKVIESGKITINATNSAGKSLLQLAIETGCSELAMQLLDKENIDVNIQDHEGNTPLLSFMLKGLVGYDVGLKLLAHPKLDLTKKNHQEISVGKLHAGWHSYGAPGTQMRDFCLRLKEKLARIPYTPEVAKTARFSL